MPLSPTAYLGQDVTEAVCDDANGIADFLGPTSDEKRASDHVQVRELGDELQDDDWQQNEDERESGVCLNGTQPTCPSDRRVFRFVPSAVKGTASINIPTAYIFSTTDLQRDESAATLQLYVNDSIRLSIYSYSYDIPYTRKNLTNYFYIVRALINDVARVFRYYILNIYNIIITLLICIYIILSLSS